MADGIVDDSSVGVCGGVNIGEILDERSSLMINGRSGGKSKFNKINLFSKYVTENFEIRIQKKTKNQFIIHTLFTRLNIVNADFTAC